ncbi:FAD-dependent oxidoreductase, partial [Halobium palmae]
RLVVVGGGYIAAEMGYFYGAMGSEVVVVGHADRLLAREDREVAEFFTDSFAGREHHEVHTGYEVVEVEEVDGEGGEADERLTVHAEADDGEELTVEGDALLLAVGRRPNTDAEGWDVEAGGVAVDDDGFLETDDRLRASVDGVWAVGDVAGNYMFKHSGDQEAAYAVRNAVRDEGASVEYPGMAHAVFGSPQVGSHGKTESELESEGVEYEVGRAEYSSHPLGKLLEPEGGFAKVLVGSGEAVLGCHVVGPEASTLIHEVNAAVSAG